MQFSDLSVYLKNQSIEFEIVLDDIGSLAVGDFVEVISEDIVYVKRTVDPNELFLQGKFVTLKYQNMYESSALGKYFCQITMIRKNVISVHMIYDLMVSYENALDSSGMKIAVLDNALQYSSIENINSNIRSNYKVCIDKGNFYLLAKNQYAQDKNNFLIVDAANGKAYAIDSKRIAEINGNMSDVSSETYVLEKLERPVIHSDQYTYFLYDGEIEFVDCSKAQRLSELTKAYIKQGGSEYVNIWRHYAEKQMQLEQEIHDAAGILRFDSSEVKRPGYHRFYIKNPMTISTFLKNARKTNGDIQVVITQTIKEGVIAENYAKMCDLSPSLGYVECAFEDTDREDYFRNDIAGTIELDLKGCRAVYERRIAAFDKIQNVGSANKALLYLLDGRTVNSYAEKELNDDIKVDEKIISRYFPKYPPNPSQRKAIEIALHTPDLAIIQGPPGTGKTKVIQTIHAHLQEKQKNADVTKDKYLLTAYQRDATKNMAEGFDAEFDLPIITYYGGRNKRDGHDFILDKWCDERAQKVREANPEIEYFSEKKRDIIFVNEIRNILLEKCSVEQTINMLQQAIERARNFIGEDLFVEKANNKSTFDSVLKASKDVESMILRLKRRMKVEKIPELVFYVSVIPTSAPEMSDKGEELIQTIIQKVGVLTSEISIKSNLVELEKASIEKNYAKLSEIKAKLILQVNGWSYIYEDERLKISEILNALLKGMKAFRFNEKQEIISEYLYSLYPGKELEETIAKYQQIIAATHQLASENITESGYKDVLIDEAARSCPADLMIPLSEAQNRIILVGDDKQLPQYIEDDVLKIINRAVDDNKLFDGLDEKAIKEKYELSMFTYLTKKAENLCRIDAKHSRVIQLNQQYRMADILGSIVSHHFYSDTVKNSGLPQEHFLQNYRGIEGKNLIWVDKSKSGNMEKRSTSKSIYRQCEADTIVEYIKQIVKSPNWNISDAEKRDRIGVITFYSKQRDIIQEKLLGENGVGEENVSRIEVGTVDSFQGKEFGVVFLSLVRTNDTDTIGHLDSKNRMCVALSRAIKCLIVVGNSNICNYAGAEKKIPALIDVLKCCKENRDGVCEYRAE